MSSAVPYAKANLLAICVEALPDVQVTWGYPGQLIESECLWLDDAVGTERPSIGQVSHREKFTIPVVVMVHAQGDDHQSAEERAWQLVAAVEAAVLAHPSLNGAQGVTAAYVTGKTPEGHIADAARAVSIVVEVTVESKV
ncbi:MAG: hypothetical protein Q8O56_12860 [Solirubrobacteraceae bacterium]|nr:hypothetical protein [Solirubrobacteraceae bacterium]